MKNKEAPKLSTKGKRWTTKRKLEQLTEWASKGLTLGEIAHNMGISRKTLYDWKNASPEIFEAIEEGREAADEVIEGALYRKSIGFQYIEKVITVDKDGEIIDEKTYEKQSLPEVNSIKFWLANRNRDRWSLNPSPGVDVTLKADDGFFEALGQSAEKDWDESDDEC